jgi:lipopolysaccharide biosynthesis glycosyltransferase
MGSIVLVLGADDTFTMPMAVTLHSGLHHIDRSRSVVVYLFYASLSAVDKEHVRQVAESAHPRVQLVWCTPRAEAMQSLRTTRQYSAAIYYRLLIPDTLPQAVTRAIWLDSDMIVRRDLASLWDLDLRGHPVAGVANFSEPTLGAALPARAAALGLSQDAAYLNSGLLVMDLDRWRSTGLSSRIFSFLTNEGDTLTCPDQDALNLMLAGDGLRLDPIWNVQLLTLESYGREVRDPAARRLHQDQLLHEAAVLHYTGRRKPWHGRFRGWSDTIYFQAVRRSGWFSPWRTRVWIESRRLSHGLYGRAAAVKDRLSGRRPDDLGPERLADQAVLSRDRTARTRPTR